MPLPPDFVNSIEGEILKGLPNEQARRASLKIARRYYQLEGAHMIVKRDAESDQDFQARPKRSLPFARRVIQVLTSRLYDPGPSRRLEGQDAASQWLDRAYQAAQINSLCQVGDRIAHLTGFAAFQVGATGDPARPLAITVWHGFEECVPFELADEAGKVAACVTIDEYDERTRYTLWTDEYFKVYLTDKLAPGQTSGGRLPRYAPELSDYHGYGCLPFAFLWFELPVAGCDEVKGLGTFLANLNSTIDEEASDLAQAVKAYHTPDPILYDGDVGTVPIKAPGKWMRINSPANDFEGGPQARAEYLQADLDIAGGWLNIRSVIDSELEGLGIPLTAYRMDSNTLPSGAALVAEQKPLEDYARGRREPAKRFEGELARVSCAVGGAHYRRADLVAAAKDPKLSAIWPAQAIELPGPERDQQDSSSIDLGLESVVMVTQRRFGLTRDQAIAHLKQVAEDRAIAEQLGIGPPKPQRPADQVDDETPREDDPPADVGREDEPPVDDDEDLD